MPIGLHRRSHHWRWVALLFLLDGLLVWLSFGIGIWLRFGDFAQNKLFGYGPGIFVGSVALPVIFYIGGFYSHVRLDGGVVRELRWLAFGLLAVFLSVLAMGSIDFSSRIGRGVLVSAMSMLALVVGIRHLWFLRRSQRRWRKILCLVSEEEDEAAAALLHHLWGSRARELGIVTGGKYTPVSGLPLEGWLEELCQADDLREVDMVLVRDRHLGDPDFGPKLRQLRYQGVEIVSLADACEEAYQAVPLGLVTDSWLFRASNQAGLFYIKKLKRLFDILAALFFLVALSPFLALGAFAVRLSSPGPVLFRQKRAGRLERPITVMKLRTMHVDSENAGARWSGEGDPRIFPAGKWLRKFRIDEIPQLLNVIRGDMSFVGPRPEQAIMIDELDEAIPFYRERLLIQPGLTGWAQVQYPYGASVEDAARKLEYDLYYMKHMSLFLDFFILLETVKIILLGGVRGGGNLAYSQFRRNLESSAAGEKNRKLGVGNPASTT